MKTECAVVKDLLPLYVEKLTSETSNKVVEEHLAECEQCGMIYKNISFPDLQIHYDRKPAESFKKYVKKSKRKLTLKVVAITIVVAFLVEIGVIGLLVLDTSQAQVYEDTNVSHYLWYMGENAKKEYVKKWGMDESIFPKEILDETTVVDYKMVYYDPWDAQFLSYLVVDYDEEHFQAEKVRLAEYDSKEYRGYFGAEGFTEEYTLLAMEAHPDFGLIYALSREDCQIIYVELIFCNYFMDIDYKNMISEEYLPIGFDATMNSSYRRERLGR